MGEFRGPTARATDLSPLTCRAEELYTVIASGSVASLRLCLSNPAMNTEHLVVLLRSPRINADIVGLICDRYDWLSDYKVQCGVVNCVKTPHTIALRILPLLFWNDLVKTAANYRLSPRLRRIAENYLRDKILELTLGEKLTLARTGPRRVIQFLRSETDPRVVSALLQNPSLVEDDVLLIINDELTDEEVLNSIGKNYKWSLSYSVRVALVRNARTPLSLALSFLSRLRRQDLDPLAHAPHTPELIRRAAERILAGDY